MTVTLKLYNTLTRTEDPFVPQDPAHVRMYVCGPTVYDFAHIGNARPIVVFDLLARLLRRLYGRERVTYVRNITDIDDKIIDRARESGESIETLTERYTAAFHKDMKALGAEPPDIEPCATKYIPQMIKMIEQLLAKRNAYKKQGHILFDVSSMPSYGKLSHRSTNELIAGARVDVAPYKMNPADFVLWKPSTSDQPGWDSPWGRGRPGWHLECSAMNEALLGKTVDIHGGGQDLIFPHHENEIAQSECAHDGTQFVVHWMHNGYVTVNGEKMSKSLGNFLTVRDLLEEGYSGEAIRLALISTNYRKPLNFSITKLVEAESKLDHWHRVLATESHLPRVDVPDSVLRPLMNDLNTRQAIARLDLLAKQAEHHGAHAKAELRRAARFMGFQRYESKGWLKRRRGERLTTQEPKRHYHLKAEPGVYTTTTGSLQTNWRMSDARIDSLVSARTEARMHGDFREADRIRDELKVQGVILEDKSDGTTGWRRE